MANRYIRHGATFCGDGTTSALATVNGGPGAWNDIAVFESTIATAYGTLPAGTDVYVRTKDEAGNDITVSSAVAKTLGQSAATELAPITWVIDQGDIWPGIAGKITYNMSAGLFSVMDYNNIFDPASKLHIKNGTGGFQLNRCHTTGMVFDASPNTTANVGSNVKLKGGTHINPHFRLFGQNYSFIFSDGRKTDLHNPRFELLNPTNTVPLFGDIYNSAKINVYGGEIFGPGANETTYIFRSSQDNFLALHGTKYPVVMPLASPVRNEAGDFVFASGADGLLGSAYISRAGSYDSRADGNPPTLNAALELSTGKAWSYRMYPYAASAYKPLILPISKLWTQDPAALTITQEFLLRNTFSTPKSSDVYIAVQYTDATTGAKTYASTLAFDGAVIPLSEALWTSSDSATTATWGMTAFTKRKVSLTLPSSVKKDSEVIVLVFVAKKSAASTDILFVCPDPVFS